jgi:hypothetical protein
MRATTNISCDDEAGGFVGLRQWFGRALNERNKETSGKRRNESKTNMVPELALSFLQYDFTHLFKVDSTPQKQEGGKEF